MYPAKLWSKTWKIDDLVSQYPPKISNINKKIVYEKASLNQSNYGQNITVSQYICQWGMWDTNIENLKLNNNPLSRPVVIDYIHKDGFYDYIDYLGFSCWHVNFADRNLFYGYGSGLFAQDEIQVAEHPVLGSVREYILAQNAEPLTSSQDGFPMPFLISGVPRQCIINTEGIYGNAFGSAQPDTIHHAIKPTMSLSNIITMNALRQGQSSVYSESEISKIFIICLTGFQSAVIESKNSPSSVVINTGYWGCGAFGGNRVLMAAIQLVVARILGIKLAFWTGKNGNRDFYHGLKFAYDAIQTPHPVKFLSDLHFKWGVSDGN